MTKDEAVYVASGGFMVGPVEMRMDFDFSKPEGESAPLLMTNRSRDSILVRTMIDQGYVNVATTTQAPSQPSEWSEQGGTTLRLNDFVIIHPAEGQPQDAFMPPSPGAYDVTVYARNRDPARRGTVQTSKRSPKLEQYLIVFTPHIGAR